MVHNDFIQFNLPDKNIYRYCCIIINNDVNQFEENNFDDRIILLIIIMLTKLVNENWNKLKRLNALKNVLWS